MNELISILVPCYNGEKTIERLLDSVLAQTYRPLELIIVNDGSTDTSAERIEAYRARMEADNIRLTLEYQQNRGLGGAIDTALKLFHGAYFTLADADDFLAEESVSHRLSYLQAHPEYAVVSSNAYAVPENDVNNPVGKCADAFPHMREEQQFWHLLLGESLFCPGCHLYRTSDFLTVNPTRSIYPARRGQNWQLLLPMYYRFKRGFLDEPLYYYVVSPNSMSKDKNAEQMLFRCDEHEDIIRHALATIPLTPEDKEKSNTLLARCYARKRLKIAAKDGRKQLAKQQYAILKQLHCVNQRDRYYRLCASFPFLLKK